MSQTLKSPELREINLEDLLQFCNKPPRSANAQMDHLVLKEGNLFLITDKGGNIAYGEGSHLGLYWEDTRYLSHWVLSVRGHEPTVLSSQANRVFCDQIDMTTTCDQIAMKLYEHSFMHLRRRQVLEHKLVERLRVSNYLPEAHAVTVTLEFGADFCDMFEVRGMARHHRGTYYEPIVEGNEVRLNYRGLDSVLRTSTIVFVETPTRLNQGRAEYDLVLQPNATAFLEFQVQMAADDELTEDDDTSYQDLYTRDFEDYSSWRATCTRFRCDQEFLAASLQQSITDLRALMITYDSQPIVSAGIPWYSTPFGRDSLITSLQTLIVNPDIARNTLRFLARYQGTKNDDITLEEPGKILHEIRRGEMARCREIPHIPYFGTADATPLFLMLLHAYYLWTNDEALVKELLPNAERALEWIDKYGDHDGDGFVEYWRYAPRGCLHQGWKDSIDGVVYPDNKEAKPPIALVEVQGYVYAAKAGMSRIFSALGHRERALLLRNEAVSLRERIEQRFWMKDQRFYAIALDKDKNPVNSVTSNAAHLLYCKAASTSNARRTEMRLLAEDMYSGWGVRTMSSAHPAYNPLSYHNGSVWPHDNAIAAAGLCNYNFKRGAERIFKDLYEACLHFQYYRLPELFCGTDRLPNDSPVHYPVACSPQAWAAGSFFMILESLLGIRPDAPKGLIRIENPHLPAPLGDLTIHNMRIGASQVSLHFARQNDRTFVNVIEQSGAPVRVVVEWS